MIGRLTGTLEDTDGDGLIMEVAGVGYDVLCPLGTRGRARALPDGRQVLLIYTHVREDQFTLFGFADDADRAAFRQLIAVSNVGPKIAVAILSAMDAGELARAISQRELGKLTAIGGVGKKTAERLILELKDKVVAGVAVAGPRVPRTPATHAGNPTDPLTSTLVKMGYKPVEVERIMPMMADALASTQDLSLLLREALKLLAK
jgi:holliday junction DNA helicase RuvA